MAQNQQAPSAGYKFNSFQEIKSHSSILYNERMAILFYMLDMKSISMNTYYRIGDMLEVRSIIKQIYKNVRMLIRNNPTVRATLNLETKDPGVYITDLALGCIDRMVEFCESRGYTTKKVYIIVQELNTVETLLKDILQYFHYFIRPEFRQKPDLESATERYKEIADDFTVEELRAVVGKKNRIDFEGLGSSRIDLLEAVDKPLKISLDKKDDDSNDEEEDDDSNGEEDEDDENYEDDEADDEFDEASDSELMMYKDDDIEREERL